MSKRLRNRIILVGGFLICLGIAITAIILIIVAICGGFSSNNSIDREVAEVAGVEVIYDTSAEPVKPVVSAPTADDTSSTTESGSETSSDESSDVSSEDTPVSSEEPTSSETSSADTSSADTSSTPLSGLVNNGTEKTPEDFVADFANNAA